MSELYIGLMSGTSIDGIDAVLVDFADNRPTILNTHYMPYPSHLREKILALCLRGENEIERLGVIDHLLGKAFAQSVNELLAKDNVDKHSIKAIGSHGQTIRHHPHPPYHFSLQIGDPNIIAAETGIPTVADFRRKDIALGGQGAPLVPAFHSYVFSDKSIDRAIVNIGGIANITFLPKDDNSIFGFDTGPGNVLLDAWINLHLNKPHDQEGEWASQGVVDQRLLDSLLSENYFQLKPPKSTGREYFNLVWLQTKLQSFSYHPINVQTTLVELTTLSIMQSIRHYMAKGEILICGGGAFNTYLMERLKDCANGYSISTTEQCGIAPDWVEATAFAWLARQTIKKQHGNLASVTGARRSTILGGIYY